MLIFEVISPAVPLVEDRATRKYKCTSGPRKGQRVAKLATCSAPISHHKRSYGSDDDNTQARSYVPTKKKSKKHKKKKIRPHKANIKTETQVNEYGGANQPKITKIVPGKTGKEAEIDNNDGTRTIVSLNDLTKNPDNSINVNTANKPGQKPDPKTQIRIGDKVKQKNENK